jgi:UDP-GlcNAc:undecaprenyl-phosphate GlcNAc-1-phosphate transferase
MIFVVSSFCIAFLLTRIFQAAPSWRFVAEPNPDVPTHVKNVPLLGGVAILLGLAPCIVFYALRDRRYLAMAASLLIVTIIGSFKDRVQRPVSPVMQLMVQLIAAVVLLTGNPPISIFHHLLLDSVVFILLCILMINAWNFLDVVDGLAAGTAFITGIIMGFIAHHNEANDLMIVSFVFSGAILGFLIFNFPPARIFMGDVGSFALGIFFSFFATRTSTLLEPNILLCFSLLFLMPIWEMIFTIGNRIAAGNSPFKGNAQHFSLVLLHRGWRTGSLLLLVYVLTSFGGLICFFIATAK